MSCHLYQRRGSNWEDKQIPNPGHVIQKISANQVRFRGMGYCWSAHRWSNAHCLYTLLLSSEIIFSTLLFKTKRVLTVKIRCLLCELIGVPQHKLICDFWLALKVLHKWTQIVEHLTMIWQSCVIRSQESNDLGSVFWIRELWSTCWTKFSLVCKVQRGIWGNWKGLPVWEQPLRKRKG